ncbi:folliculin-interacting protein 2-like isoform X2 [Hypanus sabinus]|uniref:folliculin-interacting protein 2-like isoform X2 n=1 Tax=Hypanus sabinus TaxID=79690 RepID=UPI0028C4C38D|nr:folliculin-interacting protein 2-like isoform X2 [Hypanus sabinus]
MAPTLLQKLFNKRANAASPSKNSKEGPGFSWTLAEFHVNQIRLIVYQDCERRGRHVLFDSKAVHRVDGAKVQKTSDDLSKLQGKCCHTSSSSNYTQNSSSSSASNTKGHMPRYQYSRPASDVNMLGEMMFGSVAMSYKGSTLKIHHIRSPPQLMISKVFSAKMGTAGGSSNMLHDSFEYINQENFAGKPCPGQNGGSNFHAFNNLAHSTPVDMPSRGQNEDGDSGIARSASLSSLLITPLPSPNSSFSTNCASSFQRRWLRNQTTSLENGILPRWSAEEKFMMADESYTCNPQMVRRKKIAISVVFSLPEKEEENRTFQEFFFSHFPLFETHLNKLKTAIEKAMISSRKIAESSQRVQVYISRVMEGLGEFRTTIYNLYSAPRITDPAWLTMMFNTSEKNKLCHRFVRDFTLLIEQLTKNQFLSALLTAVLTYHLAWVPTVMPNDLPPIKTFHEKHASQNVNLLGKSHPYNPLWAQLGDLYGAIGSPVRLTKTVVVGKRKELVQQILYVLTYFIRCSDLQENEMLWKGKLSESETAQSGAMISTILEKGEVEKSEYVVVTVHKDDPGPMTPIQSLTNAGQRTAVIKDKHTSVDSGLRPSSSGNTELDTCVRQTSEQCCRVSSVGNETNLDNTVSLRAITAPVQETKLQSVRDTVACNDEEHTHEADGLVKSSPDLMSLGTVKLAPTIKSADSSASTGINCPERPLQRSPRLQDRVMFQLGCSFSPDSDIDSRRRVVERNIEQKNGEKSTDFPIPKDTALSEIDGFCQPVVDQSEVTEVVERVEAKRQHHLSRVPHEKNILECFTENNSIEASTLRELTAKVACSNKTDAAAESSVPSGQNDKEVVETMRTCNMKTASVMVSSSSGDQNSEGRIISDIPYGEKEGSGKKSTLRIDGDIPRNESSDSALGDSDDEESSHNPLKQGLECCNETQARVAKFELLAPSVKMNSKPSLNNFGRSLFGGYCPQYVPDFVLHGINSDEKLKHCLMADLAHAVQHPVLDEPIAEAICIIADTDKWSVQVATSQRKAVDNKLGKEILVSNFVSCLLQSILQLYKLQLPADFCVIHLEDRLQELYFKSKMLSEYLKGHARVHVKELGMVLGIESSDLPLLSAIASTHSPSVAQILL